MPLFLPSPLSQRLQLHGYTLTPVIYISLAIVYSTLLWVLLNRFVMASSLSQFLYLTIRSGLVREGHQLSMSLSRPRLFSR
jgi:hypothetical protein